MNSLLAALVLVLQEERISASRGLPAVPHCGTLLPTHWVPSPEKGQPSGPDEGAPAVSAASSFLGGAPRGRFGADPSLTIICFHIEAESQVLVTVQEPAVTGCCHVQHQPALVPRSERLKIQKEQVRLPVDTKEQLTEGRHSCLCVSSARRGTMSGASTRLALAWVPSRPYFTVYSTKVLQSLCTDGETEAQEFSDPSMVPQPRQQGGDLNPGLMLAYPHGDTRPWAKHLL